MSRISPARRAGIRWRFYLTLIWLLSYVFAVVPLYIAAVVPMSEVPPYGRLVYDIGWATFKDSFLLITYHYRNIIVAILAFWFITAVTKDLIKLQPNREFERVRVALTVILTIIYNLLFLALVLMSLVRLHFFGGGDVILKDGVVFATGDASLAIAFLVAIPNGYMFGVEARGSAPVKE